MHFVTWILLTILFVFKEVSSQDSNVTAGHSTLSDIVHKDEAKTATHSPCHSHIHVSMEHDITKALDRCIANMFDSADSDTVFNLLWEMSKYKMDEFEYKMDFKSKHIKHEVVFRDITFILISCVVPLVEWDFSKRNLQISFEKLVFNVKGALQDESTKVLSIHVTMQLLNVTMNIFESPENRNQTQLTMKYDSFIMSHDLLRKCFWTAYDAEKNVLPDEEKSDLDRVILEALPSMLLEHLNRYQIFDSIFNSYDQAKYQITSMYSDSVDSQNKFYYFIPRIPFFCFHLKKIIIKGLMNFQMVHVYDKLQSFTHTLLIENVEGRMILDYGRPGETPMKLNFKTDYLTISINKNTRCVSVNARYYYVNGTDGLLTYRQSPLMMNTIETAIASYIMSSMKVERTYDVKILEQQIQIQAISDWPTMRRKYQEWIPFNNDGTEMKNSVHENNSITA
ncbi:uncharacterized protein LOC135837302 [Planococcus citri]|uniref:uncharacterized protein LOC135837302 n=1 Tax=Planococcus citri TaxID=170843 RepID=UPI0031F853C4